MKKFIALLAATLVISCLAGCAKKEAEAPAETSASITTAETKAETTAAKTEKTTKAETTAKAEETSAAKTEAETEAVTEAVTEEAVTEAETAADSAAPEAPATEGGTLTSAVLDKMKNWTKGNIIIEANVSQDGYATDVYVNTCGEKMYMKMDVAGFFKTTIIYDGKTTYTVSESRKNFSKKESPPDDDDNPAGEMLIDEKYANDPIETGKETIDGKEYTYEEFEDEDEKMRYYFDKNGDLCYIGVYENGELKRADFKVTFLETPDESVFAAPEGYEEISEDDMATQMLIDMFGMIASLGENGDLGSFGEINTEGRS